MVAEGSAGFEDKKAAMEGVSLSNQLNVTSANADSALACWVKGVSHRTCTGELAMVEGARDIKVVNFSLSFHGENLIEVTCFAVNANPWSSARCRD